MGHWMNQQLTAPPGGQPVDYHELVKLAVEHRQDAAARLKATMALAAARAMIEEDDQLRKAEARPPVTAFTEAPVPAPAFSDLYLTDPPTYRDAGPELAPPPGDDTVRKAEPLAKSEPRGRYYGFGSYPEFARFLAARG
jgi:hypothetical protein